MLAVQINFNTLQENIRHNMAMEEQARNELVESHRHNIVYESETYRHNVTTEQETQRHNIIDEGIRQATLNETVRHNQANEGISWYEAITNRNLAESQAAANYAHANLANAQASHQNLVNAMDQMFMATERDTALEYQRSTIELNQRKATSETVDQLYKQASLMQNQAATYIGAYSAIAGNKAFTKEANSLSKLISK